MKFLLVFLFSLNAYSLSFREINPKNTSTSFQKLIISALAQIKKNPTQVGKKTYEMIANHDVLIDELADLSYEDYLHFLYDFEYSKTPTWLTKEHYPQIQDKKSKVFQEISSLIDGYMWDNRIYLSTNKSPTAVALTLVHEVNHVLNKSHLAYYQNEYDDFMQEYRAFYSEALYQQKDVTDKKFCLALKNYVKRAYNFKIDVELIPNRPTGRFY